MLITEMKRNIKDRQFTETNNNNSQDQFKKTRLRQSNNEIKEQNTSILSSFLDGLLFKKNLTTKSKSTSNSKEAPF